MKISYYLTIAACMLTISSCCVMKTTTVTKTVTPITNDIIANLDVRSEKVTETFTTKLKNKELVKEQDLKDNAVYEALKKCGADIMVAPQFKISKEICSSTTVYTVVVSGYPAYYTNFRQMPIAEKTELRELKEGASYVIVTKSATGGDMEYDKDIIVVPVKGGCNVLNMDEVTLDRVVLKGKGARGKDCEMDFRHERPNRREPAASTEPEKTAGPANRGFFNLKQFTANNSNVAAAQDAKKACKYTYKQCRDMEIAGITLTSVGVLGSVVLCPTLICGPYTKDYSRSLNSQYNKAGWAMLGIGLGSFVAGVPLWCVGGVNKKKVKNAYYAYSGMRDFTGVTLSLQGGDGIGLALRF